MQQSAIADIAARLCEEGEAWMDQAAEIAIRHYEGIDLERDVEFKSDNSPLTQADLEIDSFLFDRLSEIFPDIPVVTEERSQSHDLSVENGYFFLVDPIDGTKEFIHKRGDFTVNIALLHAREPVVGLVCAPALGKCFYGSDFAGASVKSLETGKSERISVRQPDNNGLLVVASRSHLSPETKAFIEANSVADTRNAGSSLKFCLLAAGEADLYPRFGPTMEWDTAAGHAVLKAAGGFVREIDGQPLLYAKKDFRNPWFIAGVPGVDYRIT